MIEAPAYTPDKKPPRPYVRFETRSVEDRIASVEAGETRYKDITFVIVMAPGSRDSLELPAVDWIGQLKKYAQNQRIPAHWPRQYQDALDEFEKSQEQPLHGTPLARWVAIRPGMLKNCLACGINTIEALATANDETLARIGMGAVALRQTAQAWIRDREGTGTLALQVETLAAENAALREQLEELKASLPKPAAVVKTS